MTGFLPAMSAIRPNIIVPPSGPTIVQGVNGSGSTGSWSTSPVAGDVLVLVANALPSNDTSYTELTVGSSCWVWWKVAVGGDVFPTIPGQVFAVIEVTHVNATSPINAFGNTSATSTVPNCLAIAAAAQGGIVQSGWTSVTPSNRWTAQKALASTGAVASGAWSASTGTNYQSYVIIAPP